MAGHREAILDYIHRFPGRDDDEISAALRIRPRQTINQTCRALAKSGQIVRKPGQYGKICNFPKLPADRRNPIAPQAAPAVDKSRSAHTGASPTDDWFWEGNVVEAVGSFLESDGWVIRSKANTLIKERGIDLDAHRGSQRILVEAKGYPSKAYRDPRKAGQVKPTNPTLQAGHWFAQALLKVVQLRSTEQHAIPVIALPDFPKYRSLYGSIQPALALLGIAVMFVDEGGNVEFLDFSSSK